MGVSYYGYVGPYIKVKCSKVGVTKKIRSCATVSCHKYGEEVCGLSTKFCANCGGVIAPRDIPSQKEKFNLYDIMGDKYEDRLAWVIDGRADKKDHHVVVPNQDWPREFRFCSYETVTVSLDEKVRANELQWMLTEFKEEIELIKKEMGEDIEICWGVVAYAS
jgi:hypothetical protein